MLEMAMNLLWTIGLGASLVACIVAAVVVFVTRKLH